MSRRPDLVPWALVGPVLLVFVAFFAVPVLILFASSFERTDLATFRVIERLTLFNYRKFLFDWYYLGVLLATLKISLLVTLAALATGYPVAAFLARARPRERAILMLLIVSPLLVSLVIRSFGWVIVLGPRGVVNGILLGLGLVEAPVKLIYT
jgi:putative spermidine/putrescine transport system permease protein